MSSQSLYDGLWERSIQRFPQLAAQFGQAPPRDAKGRPLLDAMIALRTLRLQAPAPQQPAPTPAPTPTPTPTAVPNTSSPGSLPVYISGDFTAQYLSGQTVGVDLCLPGYADKFKGQVNNTFTGRYYQNPGSAISSEGKNGWIGIKTALICGINDSHDLTMVGFPQQLMIQVDLDRIPGNNVDSCALTAAFKTPETIQGMNQHMLSNLRKSYDRIIVIQRDRVWGAGQIEDLPDDWIAISHLSAPGLIGPADTGISQYFDYSIKGLCLPTPVQ